MTVHGATVARPGAGADAPLLAVDGLTVRAGSRVLLRGIDFALRAGETLVLVGESGAGKSLLAQAVMGTLPPGLSASGEVTLAGHRSKAEAASRRRGTWGRLAGLLPQEPMPALDPLVPLRAQAERLRIAVLGETRAAAREGAAHALAGAGLAAAAERYPWQVSGGMAQRAAAILATTGAPRVLVADEPTKGLDAAWRDRAVAAIAGVRDAGGCAVVITHDLRVARMLGGRLLVLQGGEPVESGEVDAVLAAPAHPFTRRLLEADPSRWTRRPGRVAGPPVLEADRIAKDFGTGPLFDALSLRIGAGERIAVQGGSGTGKSTLGNVLVGVLEPDRGTVTRHAASRAGAYQKLYQDPVGAFAPRRTLRDALQDVARRHRAPWSAVTERLARLGVSEDVLGRPPSGVSGGELQRIALARALCVRPALLFADEPTSRLDPVLQREAIDQLLDAVDETGVALLLVTHDDDLAAAVGDRTLRIGAA